MAARGGGAQLREETLINARKKDMYSNREYERGVTPPSYSKNRQSYFSYGNLTRIRIFAILFAREKSYFAKILLKVVNSSERNCQNVKLLFKK